MWKEWLISYLNTGINAFLLLLFTKTIYKLEVEKWVLAVFVVAGTIIPGTINVLVDNVYKPIFSNNEVMGNYEGYGFKGVIKKPYIIEELSCTLHDIIIELLPLNLFEV